MFKGKSILIRLLQKKFICFPNATTNQFNSNKDMRGLSNSVLYSIEHIFACLDEKVVRIPFEHIFSLYHKISKNFSKEN